MKNMRDIGAKMNKVGIMSMILLMAAFSVIPLTSSGQDEWPSFLYDAQNSGNTTAVGPDTDDVLWSIPGLGGSGQQGWSSPAVANGRVFHNQGPQGVLYCLYEINGTEIWNVSIGAAGYMCSTPAVVDGMVYVVGNKLYCLYASNGSEVWNQPVDGAGMGTTSPTVADNMVFLNTENIYCFYANNGTPIWQRNGEGGSGESTPAYSAGRVFVNGQLGPSARLICMYAENGSEIWNATSSWGSTSPSVRDGLVILNAGNGAPIYCLYASNGTELWNKPDRGDDHSSPAIAFDRVFINDDGRIYCYYLFNGTEIWQASIAGGGCSTPAVSSHGYMYVNGGANTYCLNTTTGSEVWSYPTGGPGWSSCAIANGRLFVNQDALYCFGPPLPRIDFVQIRDAPGGGGTNLCEVDNYPSYPVGYVTMFYVAAYNRSVGLINDLQFTFEWNSTSASLVSVTTPGNASAITCSSTDGGTATVSVDDGLGHVNTTLVTVLTGSVDYIQIRDAPGGGGINLCEVANYPSYPVGWSATFHGAIYNYTAGYLGEAPFGSGWDSSDDGKVSVSSPGPSSDIDCSETEWGTVTITLDDGSGHTNSTQVTVLDATVDYIRIRDAASGGGNDLSDPSEYVSYPVGHTTAFYCAAYNATSGYITGIPASWSSDGAVVWVTTPGSSTTVTCSSMNGGWVTITADDGGGHTGSTQVTVLQPTADYALIRSASGGGGDDLCNPAHYRVYQVGTSDILHGAVYNSTSGFLDDAPSTSAWTSSDSGIVSVTSPGTTATISCGITNFGSATITLDAGQDLECTTQVTVIEPAVDYIEVRDSPGGAGQVVTTAEFTLDEVVTATYYCAAYNNTTGYMEDRPGQWNVEGGIGTVSIDTNESTEFTATGEGTGTLVVGYGSASGSVVITVYPSQANTFIQVPEIITVDVLDSDSIYLEWTAVSNEYLGGYIIQRSDDPEGLWITIATVDKETTSYTDTGLEPGTTYYYRVAAVDDAGNISHPSPLVEETSDEQEVFLWFLIIIPLLIVIVAVLLIFILITRKGREDLPPPTIGWAKTLPRSEMPPGYGYFMPDEYYPPDEEWTPPPPPEDWEYPPPPPPEYGDYPPPVE